MFLRESIRVQTLTKSEYSLLRNIPNEAASKPLWSQDENMITFPTEKPDISRINQQSQGIPEVKGVSEKKDNQQIDESQKLTAELIEKLMECENQLSQRDKEKIKMVSEYEARIRNLEMEVISLKGKNNNVDYNSLQLKEENERLLNENKDLKKIKLDLELQIDRLNQRYNENADGQMRLIEEEEKREGNQQVFDRLKGRSRNSDIENALLLEINRLQELLQASNSSQISVDRQDQGVRLKKSVLDLKPLQRSPEKKSFGRLSQGLEKKV